MRQIIRILLDNALTHTPEGTKVTVTTYSAKRRAELTVSDEGPGIPQRVQGRIFERFYTADKAGGSGLGLAIARELAQRMDGRDHDHLQPPLHRLHPGPAAGPPRCPAAEPGPGRVDHVRRPAALAPLLLCLALALALALLSGCGSGDSGLGADSDSGSSSASGTTATTPERPRSRR